MKSSLFRVLITASILVFAVACGKDEKNKSGNSGYFNPYNSSNPYYQNPTQQSDSAINNLKAWYASTNEPITSLGQRTEKRDKLTYNPESCKTKTYLGFIDIDVCKQSSTSSVHLPDRIVYILPTTNKALNAKLTPVFIPVAGTTLAYATETNSPMGQGRLFTITYIKTNGNIIQYKVDTALNSAFNPVEIYDSEIASGEVVINPGQLL